MVSYDQYQKTYPFRAYDFASQGATQDQAEKNLGITKANLDSVISIMRNKMGFANVQQYGAIDIRHNSSGKSGWQVFSSNVGTLYGFFSSRIEQVSVDTDIGTLPESKSRRQ